MTASRPYRWLPDFVGLAALWGVSFLFMRLGAGEFGPLPTAFMRVVIAMGILVPLMVMRGNGPDLRRHWKPILVVGMLNSGIPFVCYAYALLSITTGLSSILNATTPLFGAVIAWLWLKDRPNGSRMAGLAIGFVGVAMLASGKASFKPNADGTNSGLAVLACLVATVCYGTAASFAKRFLGGIPPMATAAGSQIGATLGLCVPALWLWPASTPGLHAWAAVLGAGVFSTALAYILYFRLITHAGPTKALAVTFLIPVFAVVSGAIFLGEAITGWMLLCGAVIVCGTALATGLLKFGK